MTLPKNISIKFLIGLLLLAGANSRLCAQFASNLWGQVTTGDSVMLLNGNIVNKSTGELFLGSRSHNALQSLLDITGNYVGESGSKIHVAISNTNSTHSYIDIKGMATKTGNGTLIVPEFLKDTTEWDGSCIDLVRADEIGSDAETFRMNEVSLDNRSAALRSRRQEGSIIWFLAEKFALSQNTSGQIHCVKDSANVEPLSVIVPKSNNYLYQWYSCNNDGSKPVSLGSANGAQTANYIPPSDKIGTYYYYCVITSRKCSYNTDTTMVSGAITVRNSARIIEQPLDYLICDNVEKDEFVTLNVDIEDNEEIIYQWYKNGVAIEDGNSQDWDIDLTDNLINEYYVELQGCDTVRSDVVHVGVYLDLISQKMNSTLIVNNNFNTNGGYNFVYYIWYENGEKIEEGMHDHLYGHYYAGGDLDPNAEYWVELIDINGNHYRTCSFNPAIKSAANLTVYPNPVAIEAGNVVTIEIKGIAQEELERASIDIYNMLGIHVGKEDVHGRHSLSIEMPDVLGTYILLFKSETFERKIKVIVE